MIIGKVIGNIWATRKDENLNGLKFLVVEPLKITKESEISAFVAVDSVGAGIGDTVLVTKGSSARVSFDNNNIPVDATIVGIIDSVEIDKNI